MAELKELIKDVHPQPEIVAGDQGICEVATHPDAEAVITGIVGCAGGLAGRCTDTLVLSLAAHQERRYRACDTADSGAVRRQP